MPLPGFRDLGGWRLRFQFIQSLGLAGLKLFATVFSEGSDVFSEGVLGCREVRRFGFGARGFGC